MKYCQTFRPIQWVVILSFFLVLSCKKSEDVKPAPLAHSFTFKGKTYDIKDAVFKNWGPVDFVDDGQTSPTHYQNWIIFSDGQITVTGTDIAASGASYVVPLVVLTTIAGNNGTFKGGTFISVLPADFYAGKGPADKDFFSTFLFRFDKDNDSKFGPDDQWVDASEGLFTVTPVDSKFKIEFNVTTTSAGTLAEDVGMSIAGKYEGGLRVLN